MRLHEYAKKIGVSSKELVALLNEHGHAVKSHMSVLSDEMLDFLKKRHQSDAKSTLKKSSEKSVQAKKIMQKVQVSKKPSISGPRKGKKPVFQKQSKQEVVKEAPALPESITVRAMTVASLAQVLGKPVNEIILILLRSGIAATVNQMLQEQDVELVARHFEIAVEKPKAIEKEEEELVADVEAADLAERMPIIVVLGHVDHGKTSLLDYIRKTRVASREKGGITQHIGAYEASTKEGSLVFLDTPGHEAFSKIRRRGARVADLAVLIVAADDGVMPQTVEAIAHAKKMELPIIVAINKVDKVEPARVDIVRRQLSQHDLLPEEWGGDTVSVPISATTGQGVDQLLEMVALQAQMMELRADVKGSGKGYILESRMQKGRGPVATVLCHHGNIAVGDFFICGSTAGKVTSLTDSAGKAVKRVGPSIPVLVSGFDELPQAGDHFKVVSKQEALKARSKKEGKPTAAKMFSEDALNYIFKVDTISSKEALVDAVEKLTKKSPIGVNIIHADVGDISESDVELAYSTGSAIIGFHTKTETNAVALAKARKVEISHFEIIYKLLEMIEEKLEAAKGVEIVRKKIGEATVRRVFDIKNIGVVAGSYVNDGRFVRDGIIVAWRGNTKIGEGKITSLQREKKSVKEVHKGFECGFVVEGMTDWQEEDRAECYIEQPAGATS